MSVANRERLALERVADSLERLERRELDAERELARRDIEPLRAFGPQRLGWAAFLRAIPGLAAQLSEVPEAYVTRDGSRFTVRCPCGQTPAIEAEHSEVCVCGRVFVASGSLYVGAGQGSQ